jgi:hypothetical protein
VCSGTRPSRYCSTGDLGAAETAAADDLDAFGTQTHRRLHRALHGTAEGDTALELIGDALRDELGVDFRLADLDDVQLDVDLVIAPASCAAFDVRALLADDDTGTGSVDRNAAQLGRTLDHHLRDRGLRQRLMMYLRIFDVFQQQLP